MAKPTKKFNEIVASVMLTLGIKEFAKDSDGNPVLTGEQIALLKSKFGEDFATSFTDNLAAYMAGQDETNADQIEDYRKKLEALQIEYDNHKKEAAEREKNLNTTIETLSREPESDLSAEKPADVRAGGKREFRLNMGFLHNKVLDNFVNGDGIMARYEDTINTDELRKEFGEYVNNVRYDIHHQLFGTLMCTKYMTTKMSEYTEYRAAQDVISSVIQVFTPYWTPRGNTKFTPLKITNRKHKINLGIKPAEIMTELLGYMYDEGLQPKDMPIVKYIINVLLKPKVEEEREELLANGVYEEFSPEGGLKDYIEGQESGKSMDGYCTILKREKESADSKVNFLLNGVELTPGNIIEKMEEAVDSILPKFKKKAMYMHIDPDLVTMYNRAYQEKFKNAMNADSGRQRIDFSKITFAPIDGMIGSRMFFITPKENFIHLLSKNKGANKIWMQAENYDVKVFAEWWEAVGFLIAEAVFAYVPPTVVSGDATGSGNSQTV